jgi:hypothetical protein
MMALLFYSIYKKKYYRYFVTLSIIFFLSMFYAYPIPAKFELIKNIFDWNKQFIPRILSLINIIIYIRIIKLVMIENIKNKLTN